ncbi:unnamed protein product [Adineta steineri]|uniref:Uncharacterized protein n=1 Tax=Adineta steineri TaxID=433720 RepID=A0A818SRX3_9BILA|nr:unnamed protein product [Adineta steineri]CAF3667122.1 unnamed protein product [Adineta steineri]
MLELHEYDDDDDTINDQAIILRKQKYKTWLYVLLLTICLYVLFYGIWIKIESETIIISNVTFDKFDQLYAEHGQTLSCPCSTITISYQNFVSNNVTMHPVCSSIFVSKKWIEGLYLSNSSQYGIHDFRKVAYSQFELLSRLCSLSQNINSQIQSNINNTELVSINLLSRRQIPSEIDNTIEFQKNNTFSQMISFLNYWRTTIQSNFLISALGTNSAFIAIDRYTFYMINGYPIPYIVENYESPIECGLDNPIIEATFPISSNDSTYPHEESTPMPSYTIIDATFPLPSNDSIYPDEEITPMSNYTIINGFYLGCTPLDALLQSTLNCLYELDCIQLLVSYFPNLIQMNFNLNISILSFKHENKSVLDYFQNLFIENWSSNINYLAYFDKCSPSICTYTTTNRKNLSYGITLLISLYGGLIIILRLVASYSINILFKWKYHSNNSNENLGKTQKNTYSENNSIHEAIKFIQGY